MSIASCMTLPQSRRRRLSGNNVERAEISKNIVKKAIAREPVMVSGRSLFYHVIFICRLNALRVDGDLFLF